jgi:hypothetical protein
LPAIFWQVGKCSYQQDGTGKTKYDDISNYQVMLRQVHADREIMQREEMDHK